MIGSLKLNLLLPIQYLLCIALILPVIVKKIKSETAYCKYIAGYLLYTIKICLQQKKNVIGSHIDKKPYLRWF